MAFTHKASWLVDTGPIITTDIVNTFINIYKAGGKKSTQLVHQPEHNNVIAAEDWQRVGAFLEMVPLHSLDFPGGNAVSVALNPSKQVQKYDPMVLVQLESGPQMPEVL